ncbi:MAG: AAA family ATPase [Deltaproteobacteria bacterium]|nr:AAA family ATPase [Deltaproteobacteria bacterium]
MNESPQYLRGRVETLFHASPGFSAGRLKDENDRRVTFAGKVVAAVGEQVILQGAWVNHPKYGKQFQADTLTHDLDLSVEGLAHYLANNPAFVGLGPVKAKRIAQTFGRNFGRAIVENPEAVAKAGPITIAAARNIQTEWLRHQAINAAATELSAFGLTHHQVRSLIDKYGNDAVSIIKSDPYLIVRDIRGFGFKRVDAIARKVGVPKEFPPRVRAGIIDCLDDALDQGHTWIEEADLIERANKLLVMDSLQSREIIEMELSGLISKGVLACDSYDGRFLISRADIRTMERDVEQWLRGGDKDHPSVLDMLGVWQKVHDGELCSALNPQQRAAVVAALTHQITVISGGAGSGKTFTVGDLTIVLDEHGLVVVLAAPTGKAAKRLEQIVGKEAFTIHRLLGFNGHEWSRGPDDPIDADVVIIDETSMVDLHLAWRLLRAIDHDKTAIVFVGDHNQLPPVGPGDLLRDMIHTGIVPGVVLTDVVRQAGELKENSTAILRGTVARTSAQVDARGRRPWYLIDEFTDPWDVRRFLRDLYETVLADKLGYDLLDDIQLLTPKRKDILGVDDLNIELQSLVQRKLWGVETPAVPQGRRPAFLLHDKVIQRRNNYDLGIMNGSIGRVLELLPHGDLRVRFDNAEVTLCRADGDLDDLQLAYALTIHQCQGSEFPCAVVIVHKSHSFMHSQNLFYTGVSRAKQTTIVIGDRWGVRNCATKKANDERSTFLGLWRKGSEAASIKEALNG